MGPLATSLLLLGIAPLVATADYDQELWNHAGRTNNHWSYYDIDAPAPHDVDMNWQAAGGVDDTGHVRTPLGVLDSAHDDEAFFPAYLYRGLGVNQEIDLSIEDAIIKVYVRDGSGAAALDLKGGSLVFFIGQYIAVEGGEDKESFFYNLTPVTVNSGNWTIESSLSVGGNGDWGVLANNDPTVFPSDLFHHPEQWGFTIFPAASTPSGALAFDSFRIVPEPTGIALFLAALTGSIARRRREHQSSRT